MARGDSTSQDYKGAVWESERRLKRTSDRLEKETEESAGQSVCLAPSSLHSGLLMRKSCSFSRVLDAV